MISAVSGISLLYRRVIIGIIKIFPAVLNKTVGIFLLKKFGYNIYKHQKYNNIKDAFALWQACLLFVKKSRFLTYYPSRAPPSPI